MTSLRFVDLSGVQPIKIFHGSGQKKRVLPLTRSRTLTQANSVTHKLAQVFGLEHNHQYFYGRKLFLYRSQALGVHLEKVI